MQKFSLGFFFFFEKPNNQKPKTKKMSFSSFANSQYFFLKISGIGTWVSFLCKKDKLIQRALMWLSLYGRQGLQAQKRGKKTKQKCIFTPFLSLHQIA